MVVLYTLYTIVVLSVLALHVYAFVTSLPSIQRTCARHPIDNGEDGERVGVVVREFTAPATPAAARGYVAPARTKCRIDYIPVCIAGGFGVVCAGVLGVLQVCLRLGCRFCLFLRLRLHLRRSGERVEGK